MKPSERENLRYLSGYVDKIDIEEEIMFSLLPDSKGCSLLDIGCGEGVVAFELQNRGFNVYGIDFSSVAVKNAKERGVNAIEYDIDKRAIPFKNNFFDVVWAGDVIEHVFDPFFLLEEIHRVLKDNGRLILNVPNDFNIYSRIKIFLTGHSVQTDIYRELRQCKHHTFFSWDLLNYMLHQTKFSIDCYYSKLRFPKVKRKIITQKKILGKMFGQLFIVCAHKSF